MTPTIVKFHDWQIAVSGFEDGERRVHDIELGKMLGFKRPRVIRELIARHLADLPGTIQRPTVRRGKMKGKTQETIVVDEHWLTMEDALFITAKSDTKKATAILQLVIKVFTAALRAHEQRKRGSTFVDRLLSPTKCEHSSIYTTDYVIEMNRLFGVEWNGGAHPRYLGGVQQKIYKLLLTGEVYDEMKRRIPEPHHGNNLHQILVPEARDAFQKELAKIVMLAKHSPRPDDFWRAMEREYRGSMLQLNFPGAAE